MPSGLATSVQIGSIRPKMTETLVTDKCGHSDQLSQGDGGRCSRGPPRVCKPLAGPLRSLGGFMLTTTNRPKFWQIAGHAWTSLFQALRQMALLFLITYILLAGLDIAIDRVPAILSIPAHDALKEAMTAGRRLEATDILKAIGLDIAAAILRAFIIAPLAVAMHRFILLGETRRFYFASRLTVRFALWFLVLQSPVLLLEWLILFLMQTLQLFPSLAVEEPSQTPSGRIETALERAEQKFWLTLLGIGLTLLPIILAQAIAVKAFAKLAEHTRLLPPLSKAAAGLVVISLVAAAVSFLYSYTAHGRATDAQNVRRVPAS